MILLVILKWAHFSIALGVSLSTELVFQFQPPPVGTDPAEILRTSPYINTRWSIGCSLARLSHHLKVWMRRSLRMNTVTHTRNQGNSSHSQWSDSSLPSPPTLPRLFLCQSQTGAALPESLICLQHDTESCWNWYIDTRTSRARTDNINAILCECWVSFHNTVYNNPPVYSFFCVIL